MKKIKKQKKRKKIVLSKSDKRGWNVLEEEKIGY